MEVARPCKRMQSCVCFGHSFLYARDVASRLTMPLFIELALFHHGSYRSFSLCIVRKLYDLQLRITRRLPVVNYSMQFARNQSNSTARSLPRQSPMAPSADHNDSHFLSQPRFNEYSQTTTIAKNTYHPFSNSSLTNKTIFNTRVDLHVLAYSNPSAVVNQAKRKSEGQVTGPTCKKQKSETIDRKHLEQPHFADIQPVGKKVGEEPLTHVERWRLHNWQWPAKVTKSPPNERKMKATTCSCLIDRDGDRSFNEFW